MRFKTFLKRVLLFLCVVFVTPGLILFSGYGKEMKKKVRVKKGATEISVKGTLRSLESIKKDALNKRQNPRRLRPVMNFERDLPLVKKTVDHDPVAQASHPAKGLNRERFDVTVDKSFDGLNLNANGSGWPPDTTGDVGKTYYIQGVNSSIGIFRKSDGVKVYSDSFNNFFGGSGITGTPCDSNNNGDPIILYDQYAEQWFVLDFAWDPSETDGSYFSIAVTKNGDPMGEWYQYAFRADTSLMDDYPKCGVWENGIYITANMFQFSGGFQHTKVWALKTPALYNGTLTSQSITDSGTHAYSLLPTHAKGGTAPPTGAPNYMYAVDADEYGSGHSDALYVWKFDVDWNNSGNTTWTGPVSMSTAAYGLTSTRVPQPGTSNTLDTLYGRLMNPAVYRNFGTHQSVYLCHVAEYSGRRAMRWYEVRIASGSSSIFQQGTYSPDSNHRWMGSVAADMDGNIALGYSVASSSVYPSVRVAGRLSSDTPGELSQGEATIVAGTGSQTSYNRWGDYSAMSIDPVDDKTFWYTQEYYSADGTNWNTRIGSFTVAGIPLPGIADAVDNTALTYTLSGDADWEADTSVYYYDNDSAKSGTITHNQDSTFQVSVNYSAAKKLKFYWKVSSESNYDYLRFYIDNVEQTQISGTTSWAQLIYNLSSGTHTLKWSYTKDYSVSSGSDCGWVDKIEIVDDIVTDPIADALDITGLTFTTTGDGDWDVTTSGAFSGGDCIESPTLTHNEDASVSTTVSGVTSVKFYWKVSSESGYDYLKFYIDGTLQDQIAGTVAWTQQTYSVSASGTHTLTWKYDKDYSVSSGSDTGWVDKLEVQ